MENVGFMNGFNLFIDNVRSNCYMFEVGKCCGYNEIVPIFKNATCKDLYRNVMYQFQLDPSKQFRIYAISTDNKKVYVQNDDKSIREFIFENNKYFKPLYSVPTIVVYKLIFNEKSDNSDNFCCNKIHIISNN
jgi:hypothetical protein